jgi:hypothetical protein
MDSTLMQTLVSFTWEGDYQDTGYTYDLFLKAEDESFEQIASGLTEKTFNYEVPGAGSYTWYVNARNEDQFIFSGYRTFKVFSGFAMPFFEDFEIYSPSASLVSQSPYWSVYGGENTSKDAFVTDIRSYEGDQSVKISGSADLYFPIADYLTGYCEGSFMMMVDRDRQACMQFPLNDGTSVDIYFYKGESGQVYFDDTSERYISYDQRQWFEVEFESSETTGVKVRVDGQELFSIPAGENTALSGVRFATIDGPGWAETAPAVFYIDNFSIEKGSLLSSAPEISWPTEDINIYFNGQDLVFKNLPAETVKIEVYSMNGKLLMVSGLKAQGSGLVSDSQFPIPDSQKVLIVAVYNDKGQRYSQAIGLAR